MIDRLFSRLAAMYGSKFAAMWDGINIADVKQCWSAELCRYTVDDIYLALQRLSTFPPTLPEFSAMCLEEFKKRKEAEFIAAREARMLTHSQAYKPEPVDPKARERCFETAKRLGLLKTLESFVGAEK